MAKGKWLSVALLYHTIPRPQKKVSHMQVMPVRNHGFLLFIPGVVKTLTWPYAIVILQALQCLYIL